MRIQLFTAFACTLLLAGCGTTGKTDDGESFRNSFVQVSPEDPHYFRLSDGQPYIPIGCNLAAMGTVEKMEHYMKMLHENGGNFARVWLNTDLFEIETVYGQIDTAKLERIDRLLELADEYGIKIKFCIESFRHIRPGKNQWDTKASYHVSNGGPFTDADDYITSDRGHEEFLNRVRIFKERYGDNPAVFGWEMWNEMNAVETPEEHLREWNVYMLPEVKKIFPKNLVMQSLGSLDRESSFPIYGYINRLPSNEVAQVHRYLDEGAELPVCSAPVDSLASDAIAVLKRMDLGKPMLLAESGAVKPVHTGPHGIYKVDTCGTVLHDVLFAPFFSGAAGPGHLWHWDHHIDKQHTWFQIRRFANAVEGLDPAKEHFVPLRRDTGRLRVYMLKGDNTAMVWCRDTVSTWKSELEEGIPAEEISGAVIDLTSDLKDRKIRSVSVYDPWKDAWSGLGRKTAVRLPDFKRSVIVKIEY